MPLVPGRPHLPDSLEQCIARGEQEEVEALTSRRKLQEIGDIVTRYYEELDINDPANQPTDDETKTQPPFGSIIKGRNLA